jgi:prepilin signal peptidase PulO-like enzyme (type II secretory pathway)
MTSTQILFCVIFFVAGLLFGNFLNLLIYRIPRKIPILKSINTCRHCETKIPIYMFFPFISLALSRWKCKKCKNRFEFASFINPVVEILTAILFLFCYYFFRFNLYGLLIINGLVLCSLLVLISFIDLKFRIIPNLIVLPFTLVGLIINILIYIFTFPSKWWMPLAFSAGAFLFMLLIHLIYPKGMGMGDVKFSLMLGAFLVKTVVPGLFLGFVAGAVCGLLLLIIRRKSLKQSIPFGPFISIGSFIALFWGTIILKWYLSFF